MEGATPDGILYRAEYTKEMIDRALGAENPMTSCRRAMRTDTVRFWRESPAAGRMWRLILRRSPQAQIAVVKLKGAKEYLREFFVPDGVPAHPGKRHYDGGIVPRQSRQCAEYAAGDLSHAWKQHRSYGKRLGPLSSYLNFICTRRRRSVVVAGGNQANSRHHFQGGSRRIWHMRMSR